MLGQPLHDYTHRSWCASSSTERPDAQQPPDSAPETLSRAGSLNPALSPPIAKAEDSALEKVKRNLDPKQRSQKLPPPTPSPTAAELLQRRSFKTYDEPPPSDENSDGPASSPSNGSVAEPHAPDGSSAAQGASNQTPLPSWLGARRTQKSRRPGSPQSTYSQALTDPQPSSEPPLPQPAAVPAEQHNPGTAAAMPGGDALNDTAAAESFSTAAEDTNGATASNDFAAPRPPWPSYPPLPGMGSQSAAQEDGLHYAPPLPCLRSYPSQPSSLSPSDSPASSPWDAIDDRSSSPPQSPSPSSSPGSGAGTPGAAGYGSPMASSSYPFNGEYRPASPSRSPSRPSSPDDGNEWWAAGSRITPDACKGIHPALLGLNVYDYYHEQKEHEPYLERLRTLMQRLSDVTREGPWRLFVFDLETTVDGWKKNKIVDIAFVAVDEAPSRVGGTLQTFLGRPSCFIPAYDLANLLSAGVTAVAIAVLDLRSPETPTLASTTAVLGLSPNLPALLQALVTFDTLVNPSIIMGEEDMCIHHISNEDVQDQPKTPEALSLWAEWMLEQCLKGGGCTPVLAGHNIQRYLSFLKL